MNKDNETSIFGAGHNPATGGATPQSDMALRLLEAEHFNHLYEAMERALIGSPAQQEGCMALLRAACETLGAESGALCLRGEREPSLVWPQDAVIDQEVRERLREPLRGPLRGPMNDGQPVWTRPVGDSLRLMVAAPTPNEHVVLITLWQSREPGEGLLRALYTLGLRIDSYIVRKQAEDELREREQRWATTLTSIGDAVITTDTAGRITFMNSVAEALTGWTSQEAMQRPVTEVFNIVNESTRRRVEDPVTKVLETGMVSGLANHTMLIRKDGTEMAVDDSGAPIRGEDGRTRGVVLVFRDITARRRAEQALKGALMLTQELYTSSREIGMANTPDDVLRVLISTGYLQDTGYAFILAYDHPWTAESGAPESVEILAAYTRPVPGPDPVSNAVPITLGARYPVPRVLMEELQLRTYPWVVGDVTQEPRISEESQAQLAAAGIRAFAAFPLIAGGGNFGVIAFYFYSVKTLTAEDVRHVQGLVDQIAATTSDQLALEREKRARQQVERTNGQIARLQVATADLSAALGLDEVADVILRHSAAALGATAGAVVLLSQDGAALELVKGIGYPEELLDHWRRYPVDLPGVPMAIAVRRKQAVWLESPAERDALRALAPDLPQDDAHSAWAALPLILGGRVVGGLGLSLPQAHTFSAEERGLLLALAYQCALALERARLFEAEAQARHEAEHASELRLRFLGMISHELRTPLTAIKGFATTLLAEDVTWDPSQQRDFIQTIDQEADKLTDMIEQLLDLSRIESGSLRVDPQPQSLATILEGIEAQLTTLTSEHDFVVRVPEGLSAVRADKQRVGQVLVNLVSNAAKYSPSGAPIILSASEAGDGYVGISVRDEGTGISPEDLPYVFEAFRRGNGGAARQTKGAGLGLAICKGIVEAHGGRIWIEKHAGSGAIVSFTLPIAG